MELFSAVLGAVSANPAADTEALKRAGLSQDQAESIEAAVKSAVARRLELALTIEMSALESDAAAFHYEVDLPALDAAARSALDLALHGDLSALEGGALAGISRIRSIWTRVRARRLTLEVNLHGIYNFTSVAELVRTGTMLSEPATGALVLTDRVTADRVRSAQVDFGADTAGSGGDAPGIGEARAGEHSDPGPPARAGAGERQDHFSRLAGSMPDVLFQPLQFRNLTVKNRILRSNISRRFDNYDGSGNQARINWELKFARGGVGAIISSFVPVTMRGRIVPNYATIDRDERVPFWRELGKQVHEHGCKFILQLSHAGRQRDIPGIEFPKGLGPTDRADPVHGFECDRMTVQDIRETVAAFAAGARRAREAGLDGVELHGANGYLFTQFLSSAINDRQDDYGGSLANRARFMLDVVAAIRAEVGGDFHLQVKISGTDYNNALAPLEPAGNTIKDTVKVAKWLEQAGVDALHVSTGSSFPHPRNPAGEFPVEDALTTFPSLISSGRNELFNYLTLRALSTGRLYQMLWAKARGDKIEGINLADTKAVKKAVGIPVISTGGFQTASVIEQAILGGACDAVSIARPLVANNDLVKIFERGLDRPERPCTYCNKCLVNVLQNPLGCYEESRFESREQMLAEIMSVFQPPPFG